MNTLVDEIVRDTVITRKSGLLAISLGNETALMCRETGKYYALGETGSRIWEILETSGSVQEIVEILLMEFKIDENTCKEHVIEYLGRLLEEGLVMRNRG